MKYGRHKIDKAGEILVSSSDQKKVAQAQEMIDDWRNLHLTVLDALQASILPILYKEKVGIIFTSRRLKRMTSIVYKLDINPDMRLGGMQDIVGLRVVLDSVSELSKAFCLLQNNIPAGFELLKIMDYVASPKKSGYRSIHLIYKIKSENTDIDGMRAELQIRTKLQHNWAMAVETAGLDNRYIVEGKLG